MLTIVRRELPPWARRRSSRPAAFELPSDWERGDRLPRRWSPEHPPAPMRGGSTAAAYSITGAIFAMTTGAKTALSAIAPAGHGLALTELSLTFDGISATAVPAYVELCTSTQAGTGTVGTAPTIAQVRGRATGGSAPTAAGNFTVEPTVLARVRHWYVSPNGGIFVYPLPLGREIECDSSAGTLKALSLRINVTANVNLAAYMEVEAVG